MKSYNNVSGCITSCNNTSLKINNVIPTVSDASVDITTDYIFKLSDFTTDFTTYDSSSSEIIRILTLPNVGIILFNNTVIPTNFEFNISDINKLTYKLTNTNSPIIQSFTFQTSNNNINKYFSNMATFTLNINAHVNLPPSSVGDNSITIDNATTHTFTVADFTTNTTPAYSDPEGDSAENLKVLTLPVDGNLQFNNINVTINQIIPFLGTTSIASGALKYIASQSNQNQDIETFTYEISDTGSNTFVG